jgi:hypothetical protein
VQADVSANKISNGNWPADNLCRFTDFAETIADTVAIQINDFDSVKILVSNSGSSMLDSARSPTSSILDCLLPNLKHLSISLRFPLATLEALENANISASPSPSLISAWIKLPIAIKHMSKLRKLQIWLDHGEPCSWSLVNERAILSPLAFLSNIPSLEFCISLPKLHPKWEQPDRHFTEDDQPLPFALHRRYRQRNHAIEASDGSLRVKYEPDFPVLYELTEWDSTMEEVEHLERGFWEMGGDPAEVIRDFGPQSSMYI